jgi:hypothetical protein
MARCELIPSLELSTERYRETAAERGDFVADFRLYGYLRTNRIFDAILRAEFLRASGDIHEYGRNPRRSRRAVG